MGRKLKAPTTSEQPAEAPATDPVAAEATALLESDAPNDSLAKTEDDAEEERFRAEVEETEVLARARGIETAADPAEQDIEPQQIADADVPVSPTMTAQPLDGVSVAEEVPFDAPAFAAGPTPPQSAANYELVLAWNKAVAKRWQQFRQWETDVETAKERHTAAAITQAQIKESHKIAKAAEEEALEELRDLLLQQPKELVFAEFAAEFERNAERESSATPMPLSAATNTSQPAEPNTSTAWREVPITKLDLPEKLIERLQESGVETIGQLEDLRAKCHDHTGEWPKGIGKAKITKIEDAVLDWLTKNRDQQAFEELQSGHATEQPATEHPAEETVKSPATSTDPEEFANAINARAVELDDGTAGCLDDQLKAGYWHQGYDHYEAGGELRACGLPPSPAQDDFIRGWLAAGQVEDWPDADEAIDDEPPAGEEPELQESAASNSSQLFDPDNI